MLTKNKKFVSDGCDAAIKLVLLGMAIGVGGKSSITYVLYGFF